MRAAYHSGKQFDVRASEGVCVCVCMCVCMCVSIVMQAFNGIGSITGQILQENKVVHINGGQMTWQGYLSREFIHCISKVK